MGVELGLNVEDSVRLTVKDLRKSSSGINIEEFEVVTFVQEIGEMVWGWVVGLLSTENFVNRYPVAVRRGSRLHQSILGQKDAEEKRVTVSWGDP